MSPYRTPDPAEPKTLAREMFEVSKKASPEATAAAYVAALKAIRQAAETGRTYCAVDVPKHVQLAVIDLLTRDGFAVAPVGSYSLDVSWAFDGDVVVPSGR